MAMVSRIRALLGSILNDADAASQSDGLSGITFDSPGRILLRCLNFKPIYPGFFPAKVPCDNRG